ncbi:hypothetical protein D3C71_2168780 [compost metagenome]
MLLLDNGFGNGQAKPVPALLACPGSIGAVEPVEDPREMLRGDALAGIGNGQHHIIMLFAQG